MVPGLYSVDGYITASTAGGLENPPRTTVLKSEMWALKQGKQPSLACSPTGKSNNLVRISVCILLDQAMFNSGGIHV